MIDIISTWISLFFPFINWFIPKRYVKISREEFENLNIVNLLKRMFFGQLQVLSFEFIKKYTHLLDINLIKN
ncbi:DUF443 domain-containing protein [Staphylococcus aureus]|uniref:DUF443 domain-containing protein n=1 Tax=Staphylococcus aureus TaxID=1280 RepID=UPI0021E41278|nr:DUF443 domain-containing protein [Staphylococcus aureus]